jgi:glycosyltransferase involved in cell wall biosynthesis
VLDLAGPTAFYIDPDIWIMDNIDHLSVPAIETGIVLTPHLLQPLPDDGATPEATSILQAGVYNLGFIGVSDRAKPFLEWWGERLRRDCIVDPAAGLFVDQRWVDFAPGFFDHAIIDDPALNIAYWNLGNRTIGSDGDRYLVDGAPVKFIHLSGYDPDMRWQLSKHQGDRPRTLLSEHNDLARLCNEYGGLLLAAGYAAAQQQPFTGHVLDDGSELDDVMRYAYREALLAVERPETRTRWSPSDGPPNPFDSADRFWQWLAEPADAPVPLWMNRYLYALYSRRDDLKGAFPDIAGPGGSGFRMWLVTIGVREFQIPPALLPGEARHDHVSASPIAMGGVNVVGYLKAELGIGEAARNVVHALEANGVPTATLNYDKTVSRQDHEFDEAGWIDNIANPYDLSISCVNADVLPDLVVDLGTDYFTDRYHVGYWAWELDEFPEPSRGSIDLVDEIWMNSEFAASGLRKLTDKPVHSFPIPVLTPQTSGASREDLGLPEDRFIFLFIFDYLSVLSRKNPLALIEAFTKAFSPDEGPVLVIKTVNADRRPLDAEQVRLEATTRPDILLVDQYLSVGDKNALMATADAYVSLHRSEGFGLTMAEAMALGKPTIATGYSGNLEFMDDSNSLLVEYTMAEVPDDAAPYRAGAQWADPNIEHAAHLMRRVVEDPETAAVLGAKAAADIDSLHSPAARARLLASHLARIEMQGERTANYGRFGGVTRVSSAEAARQAGAAIREPITNEWHGAPGTGVKKQARDTAFRLTEPATRSLEQRDELLFSYIESLHAELHALRDAISLDLATEHGSSDPDSDD